MLELDDIQGLIVRGYASLRAARYALLHIDDGNAARGWLAQSIAAVTPASVRPVDSALHVALTASGLAALSLSDEVLARFPDTLTSGMTTPHRSRMLGDIGQSAPDYWDWGGQRSPRVDILLLVFASDAAALERVYSPLAATWATGGLTLVRALDTSDLGDREHFGFRDGISQPTIEGLARVDRPVNTIKAGEFILGYPNEFGQYTDCPTLPRSATNALLPDDPTGSGRADLGRNGCYLVFRQLRQDVAGFRRFLAETAQDGTAGGDRTAADRLAARMVGRWPGGAPLVLAPEQDDPTLANANDFAYAQLDPNGYHCPVGAHIRRAHPRDSLDPQPGSAATVAIDKRHRVLRRGREYGPPLPAPVASEQAADSPPGAQPGAEVDRGLHFIALGANITRQFEFVHHTWLNNPKFDGLYDDADPLVGARNPQGGTFTVQARPVRQRVLDLPRFVQVRGGAYFFLPGLRALHYLAQLGAR